jgi:hypothetical protein
MNMVSNGSPSIMVDAIIEREDKILFARRKKILLKENGAFLEERWN